MAHTTHHGKNLRAIRLIHGMKQELFARKMGITQQRVSKMELQENISQHKLAKAAEILDISVETIKSFDESSLLVLAAGARPELLNSSVREMIRYYQEEIAKKENRITQLETELHECRDRK